MDWYLRLADRPLTGLHILEGDPRLLAVWMSAHEVDFFAEDGGAYYDGANVTPPVDWPLHSAAWRAYVEALRAPNGAYLPYVDAGPTLIYTSVEGRLRVYRRADHSLVLDEDGYQTVLERTGDAPLAAVGLDRELGLIGALSTDGRLHIYQQHVYVGAYRLDGIDCTTTPPAVRLPGAAGTVLVADANSVRVVDMVGQTHAVVRTPFAIGSIACSPDGHWLVVAERDQGMIRVYDGGLNLLRQQSALDLLIGATPLQLLADLPSTDTAPEAVEVANDGTLVLAIGGVLCRTHVVRLSPVPQPRALF